MSGTARLDIRFFGFRKLRIQYQTAAAECGLACLAMVLTYFGRRTDLSALRQQWPMSMKGMTFAQLIAVAQQNDLAARPLRLDMADFGKLRTPCILHWGMDHFVVLAKSNTKSAVIHDPAIGKKTVSQKEVARKFTGAALELSPTSDFQSKPARNTLTLSRFFRNSKDVVSTLAILLALSIALQVFLLLTPFYTQIVIDEIIVNGDFDLLLVAALGFGGLALFVALTAGFRSWLIIYMSSQLSLSWSSGLFRHLLRLPHDYFEKRHLGDIQSRFSSLNAIRDLLTTQFVEGFIDGLMATTTLVLMYLYSPLLAGVAISSVVLYAAVQLVLFGPLRSASLETLVRTATRDSFFLESLRGMTAIKVFGNEGSRRVGFENRMAESIVATADAAKIKVWGDVMSKTIFGIQNVTLVWIAAHAIIEGLFTVGMMVAFLAYKTHFVGRSAALIDKIFQFRLARIHLDRLEDIVEAEPEVALVRESEGLPSTHRSLQGHIEVNRVSFRYGLNEPLVLEDHSFEISPGEHVAITGPSGVGKTTMFKILVGLVTPEAGEVLVDGVPLRSIDIRTYRAQIGVVMQNDLLLSGTILDNIAFFEPTPNLEAARNGAFVAGIDDEIMSMPMGYNTLVGDMGDVLSGGQKQRIFLARALYRKPKVLFLDEATSHLDEINESALVERVSRLEITRVSVAHRAETIRHADRLIQLS